jgi:hypothetical protein
MTQELSGRLVSTQFYKNGRRVRTTADIGRKISKVLRNIHSYNGKKNEQTSDDIVVPPGMQKAVDTMTDENYKNIERKLV